MKTSLTLTFHFKEGAREAIRSIQAHENLLPTCCEVIRFAEQGAIILGTTHHAIGPSHCLLDELGT